MSGAKSAVVATRNLFYRPYPQPYGRVGRLDIDTDEIVDVPYVRYAFIGRQDNIIFIQERIIGTDQRTIIDSRILCCVESTEGAASCLLYEVHSFTKNPQASYKYILDQGIHVNSISDLSFERRALQSFNILNARYLTAIAQQRQYEEQLQWWQQQQFMFMQQPPTQLFSYQQHVGMPISQPADQTRVGLAKAQRELELHRREEEVVAAQANLVQQQTEAANVIDAEDSKSQEPVIDIVTLLENAMKRYSDAQAAAGELRAIVAQDQAVVPQTTAVILNPIEMCPISTFVAFNSLIAKHNQDTGADNPNGLLIGLLSLFKQDQYLKKLDSMEFMSFFDGANPPVSLALCLAAINIQHRDDVLIDIDFDRSLVKKLNIALLVRLLHLLRNNEENRLKLSLMQWQQIIRVVDAYKDQANDDELQIYSSLMLLCSPQIARLTPVIKSVPTPKAAATPTKKASLTATASKNKTASKKGSKAKPGKEEDDDFEAAIAEATQDRLAEAEARAKITEALQQDFDRYAIMLKDEDGTIAFYKDLGEDGKYDFVKNPQKFVDLMQVTNAEGQNLLMLLLGSEVMQYSDLYINISSIVNEMMQCYKKPAYVNDNRNVFRHKDSKGRSLLDYCAANVSLNFNPDLDEGEYFSQFRPGLELLIGVYRAVLANLPAEIKQGLDPNIPRKFNLQPAIDFLKTKSGAIFVHTLFSRLDLNSNAHRDYIFNMLKYIFPDNPQNANGTLALVLLIARNEDGNNLYNIIEDLLAHKNDKNLERWLLSMYDRFSCYSLDLARLLSPAVTAGRQADRCVSATACGTDAVDFFRACNPTRDPIMKLVIGADGYHSDNDVIPEVISEITSKRAETRPTISHNANSYAIFRDNDHLCNLFDYYCAESPPAIDKAKIYFDNLLRITRGYTKYTVTQKSDQELTKEVCENLLSTAINYMFYEKTVDFSQIMSLMAMLMQKAESAEEERKAIWIRYYSETLDVYIRTIEEPYKSKALLMMQYLAPKCDLNFVDPETKQNVMHKIFGRIAEALRHINQKQANHLKGVLVRLLMAIGVVAKGDKEKIGELLKDQDSAGNTPLDLIKDGAVKVRVERLLSNQGYIKKVPGVGAAFNKLTI